jgi:hypothetical protein
LCPGCGLQRAIHHLFRLEFKEAFLANPILIPGLLLVFLLIYVQYFVGRNRFPKIDYFFSSRKFIFSVFLAIILFWIGRNFNI